MLTFVFIVLYTEFYNFQAYRFISSQIYTLCRATILNMLLQASSQSGCNLKSQQRQYPMHLQYSRKSRIQITAPRSAIVRDIFCGLSQSVQTEVQTAVGMLPSKFVTVNYTLIIPSFDSIQLQILSLLLNEARITKE